jgi:ParB/RepB/Spo0J family partition protein
MLDPRIVVVDGGFNVRDFTTPDTQAHVRELVNSIKEIGVQNPIIVRWDEGRALLVDGECRLRATLLAIDEGAEIMSVPAMSEPRGVSDADRVLSLLVRNGAKRLGLLEESVVYARLTAMGWPEEQIARKSGCSVTKVTRGLALAEASDSYKALISTGKVSATLAIDELLAKGEKVASKNFERVEAKLAKTSDAPVRVKKTDLAERKPGRYTQEDAKAMVSALKAIAADTTDARSKRIAKTVLESVGSTSD